VLAFAKPFFLDSNQIHKQGKKGISIYVDNSFSMSAKSESGQLLDEAKSLALNILDSYKDSDKFQLITNNFSSQSLRWLNKSSFIEELQKTDYSPLYRNVDQVLKRQIQNKGDLSNEYFIISDLQKVSFSLDKLEIDSTLINVIPVSTKEYRNLSLDSLYLEQPFHLLKSNEELFYKVHNYGNQSVKANPAKLYLNSILKSPKQFDVEKKNKTVEKINFRSGNQVSQKGKLIIKDFPITFDDTLFFNFNISDHVKIQHIYDDKINSGIEKLFESDTFFVYQSNQANQINFNDFKSSNFVILDQLKTISTGLKQVLLKFVNLGGSVLIIPDSDINLVKYNLLLSELGIENLKDFKQEEIDITDINTNSDIYFSVFSEIPKSIKLPTINSYWSFEDRINSNKEIILSLRNGLPFLTKYSPNGAKVYLAASSFNDEKTNITKHAIFVPTLYNMALFSQKSKPLFYFVANNNIVIDSIINRESPVRIVGNGVDFIPKQRNIRGKISLDLNNEIKKAGYYYLLNKEDTLQTISINYNRVESDLSYYDNSEIVDIAKENNINLKIFEGKGDSLINEISNKKLGIQLWKLFLGLALVFIFVEILLLRFLK
jgi:hypothetical protein